MLLRSQPLPSNAIRDAILALVHEQPGLSFRGVVRASGYASGTVRHHLWVLLRHNLVWQARLGQRYAYFPGAHPHDAAQRLAAIASGLDELDRGLLAATQKPVLGQKRLLDHAPGRCRGTLQNRLQRLQRFGLLDRTWHGRWLVYHALVEVAT